MMHIWSGIKAHPRGDAGVLSCTHMWPTAVLTRRAVWTGLRLASPEHEHCFRTPAFVGSRAELAGPRASAHRLSPRPPVYLEPTPVPIASAYPTIGRCVQGRQWRWQRQLGCGALAAAVPLMEATNRRAASFSAAASFQLAPSCFPSCIHPLRTKSSTQRYSCGGSLAPQPSPPTSTPVSHRLHAGALHPLMKPALLLLPLSPSHPPPSLPLYPPLQA